MSVDWITIVWFLSGGGIGIVIALLIFKATSQNKPDENEIDVEIVKAKQEGLLYRSIVVITLGLAVSVITLSIMGKPIPSEIVLQLGVLMSGLFSHLRSHNKTETNGNEKKEGAKKDVA